MIQITEKKTAVKIIAKRKLSADDLTALMTEICILREMDHPHIIKYVQYGIVLCCVVLCCVVLCCVVLCCVVLCCVVLCSVV